MKWGSGSTQNAKKNVIDPMGRSGPEMKNMRKKDNVEVEIVTGIGDAAEGFHQVIPIVGDEDELAEGVVIPDVLPILSLLPTSGASISPVSAFDSLP